MHGRPIQVFLDLKKAFDKVDHKILIDKLFKYSIKGKEREMVKGQRPRKFYEVFLRGHA